MEQCYGKQLAFNNELRAEINNCRTKRDQFRMIDTRLRDELAKCRKEIMCACDRATDAFQLRDEIEAKIALMKNKQAKDVQQQEADIKELYRIINHERKTRSFVNTKNDDRSAFRKEETDRRLTTVTHKSTTNSIYTALQVYEDAFDDFTIAMKAKNMVDAMQRFSGQEAELFSLCKYISRLTNESDQLEKEKELLRLNCDKCAKEEVHMFSQQKIIAKELEARLVQCETARKVTDERATYANKALDQLRVSAQRWFGILCDPVEEGILDSNADDRSLMVHLGRVEQVMLEMLQVLEFKQRKDTHMMMGAIHVREFGHQRPYEKYKALQLKIAPPDIESDHTMTSNETNLLHAIMSDDLRGDSAVASPHQQPQRAYGGAPRQPNHEGNGRRTRVSNSPRRQRQHNDQRNSGKN